MTGNAPNGWQSSSSRRPPACPPSAGRVSVPALAAALLVVASPVRAQEPTDSTDRTHPFQQEVEYRIEATQDERTHVLTGRARIRYTNRAPVSVQELVFHQYLNAFRPNSAWARNDLRSGRRTFQDLGPEEYAFERITALTIDGSAVEPVYPGSPDSTVFHAPLPEPLAPGASLEAVIDWEARLATEPRRQGRAGRHYNWAHCTPGSPSSAPGAGSPGRTSGPAS